jgi:glycosyltransferase involved in cell wall biosynthesis
VKILFAIHHFPPDHIAGAELRTFRLASTLQARGYQVGILCIDRVDDGSQEGVTWRDEIFDNLHVRRLSFNMADAMALSQSEYNNPWVGAYLKKYLESERPDFLHLVSGWLISASPIAIAQDLGIPTVVSLTDFWFLCPRISMLRVNGQICKLPLNPADCARCLAESKRRYRLPGKLMPGLASIFWKWQEKRHKTVQERMDFIRRVLNQANAIISPSEFLRTVYVASGIDENHIIFSRQGFDFTNFQTTLSEKSKSSKLRLGYIGQIMRHKGVHVLLEAIRLIRDNELEISIFGNLTANPQYTRQLYQKAKGDERVKFKGSFNRQDLSQVMKALDVIIVPSLWYENSPNIILEALAYKTPVITSDIGGMSELIHHGKNGLVFNMGDPIDLARQIQRLSDEPTLLETLRSGIEPVKGLNEEIDDLEEIYHRISHSQLSIKIV